MPAVSRPCATAAVPAAKKPRPDMLTALKAQASSWIVKILFALLILTFGIWGIGDIFRVGGRDTAVAEVGPEKISGQEFLREFRAEVNRLQPLFGGRLETEQARQLGLADQVLDNLVARALFNVHAADIGLAVSDEQIAQHIRDDSAFRGEQGQFDRLRFDLVLRQNGLTEAGYVERLRRDIAREQLTGAAAAVTAPRTMAEIIRGYRAERRVAETLLIADAAASDPDPPDEATLAAFHEENAGRYQAPEYRALTVVRISPADIADEIKVSEDELNEEFLIRRDEFDVPERRRIEQIVLADEAAAQAAAERLRQGADFAEVARETTGGEPVDLGTVERGGMLPELADAAFATPEGAASPPVESPLGWHILRAVTVEPGVTATLDALRDQLTREIALRQAADSVISIANQLEDELAAGAGLDEAAGRLGLKVQTVAAVDAGGKAPDGTPAPDRAGDAALLSLAFATAVGEPTPLTETDEGGYMIVRVDGTTPAALRPLAELREQVVADWQTAERAKAAEAAAEAIAGRLRAGEDLAAIAAERGLTVGRSKPFTRDTGDPEANVLAALGAKLFALGVGETTTGDHPEGHVVARLVEVQPAAPDDAATAALQASLTEAMSRDAIDLYGAALRREIDVTTNPRAIDALF